MSFRPSKINSVMKQPSFTYMGASPGDNLTSITFEFGVVTRLNDAVTPSKLLPVMSNSFVNNLVTFDPTSLAVEGNTFFHHICIQCFGYK